jgi:hypothetical protein
MTENFESSFLSNIPSFPKEHCFLGGSQASPICPSGKSNVEDEDEYEPLVEWY